MRLSLDFQSSLTVITSRASVVAKKNGFAYVADIPISLVI
jgi:hypothetical protein